MIMNFLGACRLLSSVSHGRVLMVLLCLEKESSMISEVCAREFDSKMIFLN